MPKFEPLVEYFVDGRRYHHCYCQICHKPLGNTGPDAVKKPTREEYGNLKCDKCRAKEKEQPQD